MTVLEPAEGPPVSIQWRGQSVPVLDYGRHGVADWKDPRVGTGLIAVMLGLEGSDYPCWGLALRNPQALTVACLEEDDIEDARESDESSTCTTFSYRGGAYEVPDLENIQRAMARGDLLDGGSLTSAVK